MTGGCELKGVTQQVVQHLLASVSTARVRSGLAGVSTGHPRSSLRNQYKDQCVRQLKGVVQHIMQHLDSAAPYNSSPPPLAQPHQSDQPNPNACESHHPILPIHILVFSPRHTCCNAATSSRDPPRCVEARKANQPTDPSNPFHINHPIQFTSTHRPIESIPHQPTAPSNPVHFNPLTHPIQST